jgi:hypothetical protein
MWKKRSTKKNIKKKKGKREKGGFFLFVGWWSVGVVVVAVRLPRRGQNVQQFI